MLKKEASGAILWIDDECVGYKCECREVIVVCIYSDPYTECPKCGKQYILHQSNTVFEVSDE
jgi:predicted nucleic acid-binding Zn ribbon protein